MNTASSSRKNIQKLQRAIVDGLEDVKAVDIRVFDTEALSPLFERVVVASGASSRQTKALAASVIEAVRGAGFPKPRTEGEANGEWIIIDCGQAVVHVMQPQIREYYHLEELWGDKPVRLKLGAAKPLPKASEPVSAPARRAPAKAAKRAASTARDVPTAQAGSAGKPAARSAAKASTPSTARPAPRAAARPAAKSGGKPVNRTASGAATNLAAPAKTAPRKVAGTTRTVVVPASSRRRPASGATAAARPAARRKP